MNDNDCLKNDHVLHTILFILLIVIIVLLLLRLCVDLLICKEKMKP